MSNKKLIYLVLIMMISNANAETNAALEFDTTALQQFEATAQKLASSSNRLENEFSELLNAWQAYDAAALESQQKAELADSLIDSIEKQIDANINWQRLLKINRDNLINLKNTAKQKENTHVPIVSLDKNKRQFAHELYKKLKSNKTDKSLNTKESTLATLVNIRGQFLQRLQDEQGIALDTGFFTQEQLDQRIDGTDTDLNISQTLSVIHDSMLAIVKQHAQTSALAASGSMLGTNMLTHASDLSEIAQHRTDKIATQSMNLESVNPF